jgi:anti-sigma factor RsiW
VNPEDDKLRKLLHARFDSILEEPVPVRMHLRAPRWKEFARAAIFIAVGVAIGLAIPYAREPVPPSGANTVSALPARAARAHLVYASEVRHPVEVGAAEQDHLVKWLSKRLNTELRVPVLTGEGYELLGGRLLPGADGPVAQFMYQESSGKRLTLYVTGKQHKDPVTAFRFMQSGNVNVFYWIDSDCGYALSGEIGRADLTRVADVVYKQLEER